MRPQQQRLGDDIAGVARVLHGIVQTFFQLAQKLHLPQEKEFPELLQMGIAALNIVARSARVRNILLMKTLRLLNCRDFQFGIPRRESHYV
ncbi:hypothetical protein FACS1894158_08320 [Betaproteobacteria bacterium]|nr:hypothetical protein FACS1894158_08320 [Betaproteobacteria bacterium]